jgi:hypothetical protein
MRHFFVLYAVIYVVISLSKPTLSNVLLSKFASHRENVSNRAVLPLDYYSSEVEGSQNSEAVYTAQSDRLTVRKSYGLKMNLLRGGEVISGKKKKSVLKQGKEILDQVKPATRVYLVLCILCTLVECIGLPAPALFAIDRSKLYEIWRPFTSVAYLGPPSMSMANSLYFLVRYGQALETSNGTGAHAWFVLVQTAILTMLGIVFGFPLQAQAMIAATIYVSSRVEPMEKVGFQFGLVITQWQLPFCLMIVDCLSQQTIQAAWPSLLGIFSGHVYHFFTEIWPKLGGTARFAPPNWFLKLVGDKKKGLYFQRDDVDDKTKLKKMKRTKIGSAKGPAKGRKLGSK